jgi:hypothetical protein
VIRTRHVLDTSQRYSLGQLPRLERGTVVASALKTEAADLSVDICLPNCMTSHPRIPQPYKTMDFVYNNTPYAFTERGFHFPERSLLFRFLHRRHVNIITRGARSMAFWVVTLCSLENSCLRNVELSPNYAMLQCRRPRISVSAVRTCTPPPQKNFD